MPAASRCTAAVRASGRHGSARSRWWKSPDRRVRGRPVPRPPSGDMRRPRHGFILGRSFPARSRMSTILYGSRSTASLVVHWLLVELGVPHELRLLDFDRGEQKSPEYLAINPQGRVPTLVMDGLVLTESVAIAMHLADLHPGAGLAPPAGTPER